MNKLDIAKKALSVAAQIGSGTIVSSIVRNNVTTTTTLEKVTVGVASFALGGVVAKAAAQHIEQATDEVVTAVKTLSNHS